jgi:tetratricopeptide (TPR) repeat protein
MALAGAAVGCGEDMNVNQIFVSEDQKNALVSLIEEAQIAYDAGEFEDALEYAEKAEKISPHNEQIAILLGYINLSLSGMDTFKIASGLISTTKKTNDDNKNGALTLAGTNNRASLFFDKLRLILGLDQQTLKKFGKLSSESKLKAFADYDVILPVSAKKARALDVKVMQHINKAIAKICPFVDEELRISANDERVSKKNCPTTTTVRERKVVSHFLWAFIHIAEAAAFYSVLQYQEEGQEQANITMRAESLKAEAADLSVDAYVKHALNLADSVSKIYAAEDPDSQFSALVNNITLAAKTFMKIGKMPAKLKQPLSRAVKSIDDKKNEVSGKSDSEQQGNSFKNQMNNRIANDMHSKINNFAKNDPDKFNANKSSLCESYTTISGGANMPSACSKD